jgi:large subunit ribosomal protein L4e
VYSGESGKKVGTVKWAGVFDVPVRPDVVHHVHRDIAKNHRQPYAVSKEAGHQTSAESWGTGRAVARIPRVAGGGTHRAGQGAFGNMCRGGRMFAPTKVYRRWHRKVNLNQRRYALVSALAASSSASLVLARGHRIEEIPEIPLVVSTNTISSVNKTTQVVKLLKALKAYADVEKVKDTKKVRAGKGKARNRRYVQRKGPLVIYEQKGALLRSFRNLPGVDILNVNRLNILLLAPGGHLGRFVIWTQDAYEKLDALYGTYKNKSQLKIHYALPRPLIANSDLHRLITSSEILSKINPPKHATIRRPRKKNPLKNLGVMVKLNPYITTLRRQELLRSSKRAQTLVAALKAQKPRDKAARNKLGKQRALSHLNLHKKKDAAAPKAERKPALTKEQKKEKKVAAIAKKKAQIKLQPKKTIKKDHKSGWLKDFIKNLHK